MYSIPTNLIPLFIISLVALTLGVRGLLHYQKVKSPLTLYFSMSGVALGLATLLYSVPFALTQSQSLLKLSVTIGDIFYYLAVIFVVKILWYIGFRKKISQYWLMVPVVVLAAVALLADIQYKTGVEYVVRDNVAYTPISTLTLLVLIFLTLSATIVGLLLIRESFALKDRRQQLRLASIGALFLLASIAAEYNFIFLQGNNTSPTIFALYSLGALVFLLGILFVRRT